MLVLCNIHVQFICAGGMKSTLMFTFYELFLMTHNEGVVPVINEH